MSDLDSKLGEVILENLQFTHDNGNKIRIDLDDGVVIAKIKKVFMDDGWHKTLITNPVPGVYATCMTGPEWYDRLMREFLKVNRIFETPEADDWVAKFTDFAGAAKKASGIE